MQPIQKHALVFFFCFFIQTSFSQKMAERAMPSDKLTFRPQTETGGMILGSVTFPKEAAKFSGYFFKVSALSEDKKTARRNSEEIFVKPEQIFKLKHQGESDNGLTYIFVLKLPEGKYSINSVRLSTIMYMAIKDVYVKGFDIPFEIHKGEITYIGNIGFNEYSEPGQNAVTLNNTFDRDLRMAQILQPYIYWKNTVNDPTRQILYP